MRQAGRPVCLFACLNNPNANAPLNAMTHPFDKAIALTARELGNFTGCTSPAYENMVGPYGGITAAVLVQAVTLHADCLGEMTALTVNYASGLAPGPYRIIATPARTNRSTQHWLISLMQINAAGIEETVITATALTAVRRNTWHANDMPMPGVPGPAILNRTRVNAPMEWLNRYDMRFVRGEIPQVMNGCGTDSLSQLWVRDDPPRLLDAAGLAAMSDVFYPRVYLRRATRVPAGTVSMTVYFHASTAEMAENVSGYLFAQGQAQAFRHGFFDQTAQLWSESGLLVATSHQLVYYKE